MRGSAFIYFGSAAGVSKAPDAVLFGEFAGDDFGAAVASAGDIDGDGFDDVAIGAPLSLDRGRVFLFRGSAAGPQAMHSVLEVPVAMSHFGAAVAGAGDVDRDGFADLIVGAPEQGVSGAAYVYRGSASGFVDGPRVLMNGSHFGVSVACFSATRDFSWATCWTS